MRHRLARAALFAAVMFSFATPAWAHAHLTTAQPAAGSTVASPAEIVCAFSEALEPKFSSLELHDSTEKPVAAGAMHLAPGDAKRMILSLPRLGAGSYTVIWHATSVDTHKTEGKFSFTVAP